MPKARGNGEGGVYWREDRKCYVGSVTLPNGKVKKHCAQTKKECQEWIRQTKASIQQGMPVMDSRKTVRQYLTDWLQVKRTQVRERTCVRYEHLIVKHVLPTLGSKPLEKLTGQDLNVLYLEKMQDIPDPEKRDRKLAPQTVVHIHRVLHAAFADAVMHGVLGRNPADLVKPPKVPAPERWFLKPDEAKQLLKAAEGDRLEALYMLALTTGMRQEELLGLKWDAVDLDGGFLEVRRTLFWMAGRGPVWGEPKSDTSRRRVSLAPVAVAALRSHEERQAKERAAMKRWEEKGLVFCNTLGGPIEAANLLYRNFRPLLVKAKLPRMRFHDLRHSTASLLLSLNESPKVVQELLGHSSIRLTLDVYSHAMPTLQQAAVNRLGGLLDGSAQAPPEAPPAA